MYCLLSYRQQSRCNQPMLTLLPYLQSVETSQPLGSRPCPPNLVSRSQESAKVGPEKMGDLCTEQYHYENLPMHYAEKFFSALKIENFIGKIWIILMLAENIDCGYRYTFKHLAEAVLKSTHNLSRKENKKNRYTSYPILTRSSRATPISIK